MQDKTAEQLSAYLDGELSADGRRFLARRLAADEQAREQLGRYHRISAVIRGDYRVETDHLATRVASAIAEEPPHQNIEHAAGSSENRWNWLLQPVAGLAIAASVALGIVAVYPLVSDNPSGKSATTVEVTQASNNPSVRSASGVLSQVGQQASAQTQATTARLNAAQRHRLNPYFVNHSEHASGTQLGGTLKYIRIVGHDTNR